MENLLIKHQVDGPLKEAPANKEILKYELDFQKESRKVAMPMGKVHLIASSDGRNQLREQLSKNHEVIKPKK